MYRYTEKRKAPSMRNFFRRIGYGLARFMYGRNGTDKLCNVLLVLYLLLWIASMIVAQFQLVIATYVISLVQLIVLFYWVFRVFSRNVVKRRREVDRFFGFFRNRRNRFRDRKTHVYKKCPHCKAMLRLPKKKGKHTVCCPACHERFSVKIRKNAKPPKQPKRPK